MKPDPEGTPKGAPPPYTNNGTTSTTSQPHIQPQATASSNDIDKTRPDATTETSVARRNTGLSARVSNQQSYWCGARLPTTFNLYYRPRVGSGGREYFLASEPTQPLNQLTVHSFRIPNVALHPGFDKSRQIASFDHLSVLRPARVSASWLASGHTIIGTKQIPKSFNFTARIGRGANPDTVEKFEWRRTSGPTVYYHLSASEGWKLVRLNPPEQARAGIERSRDGAEAVATFAPWKDKPSKGNSVVEALSFAFVGCGTTGELGEEWEVLAVMTALGIWYGDR